MGSCCNGSQKPTTGLEHVNIEVQNKQPENNSPRLSDHSEKTPREVVNNEVSKPIDAVLVEEPPDQNRGGPSNNNNNIENFLEDGKNLGGPRKSKFYYDSLKG